MAEIRRDWVTLAILLNAWGIQGELLADGLGSSPERYEGGMTLTIFGPDETAIREVQVEDVRSHKGGLVFKFRGIDTRDEAEKLQRTELRIRASERVQAEEGEYFHSDLIGCEVVLRDGTVLGPVEGWQDYGAAGLLQVNRDKGELLIPFAKTICVEIDPVAKRIVVDPPEGLLDL